MGGLGAKWLKSASCLQTEGGSDIVGSLLAPATPVIHRMAHKCPFSPGPLSSHNGKGAL